MKIEDIVNLTEGTLTNTPKVQAIEGASVYYSKIEHGDLFFSSNQEEIDQAIDNGAYAIVYADDSIVKKDDEIAWIKVSDLQLAAFKLIRYVIIKKEAKFFLLSEREMTFLKMILVHKGNIKFIADDWRKAFEQILNSDCSLFVGTDKELLNLIMYYHNHRRYYDGVRKNKTPMEILTGKEQAKDWISILFDRIREKDPDLLLA